ncbi:MAG: ParA family protein [Oscillospiraceae bacterium]|nr:ParA family protein [Oscillospiraceae bacterium]
MSIIISVSNQKGGVSKTVSSYNLASCLAINHNRKVLLADIDPQANLSEYLGYVPDGKPTMTHLIMDVCMIRSCKSGNRKVSSKILRGK